MSARLDRGTFYARYERACHDVLRFTLQIMRKRIVAIFVAGVVILGAILRWFFEHLIYDIVWALLEHYHVKQSYLMTLVLANALPFVISAIVVCLICLILRREFARDHAQPSKGKLPPAIESPDQDFSGIKARIDPRYISAADAIRYIADESEWGERLRSIRTRTDSGLEMRQHPRFAAIEEFTRAARAAEILVFGCPDQPGEHQLIAQQYWLGASVDPDSILGPEGIGETIGIGHNREQRERTRRYTALHVEGSEVFSKWPRPADAWMAR
jgi:hypothetical protein